MSRKSGAGPPLLVHKHYDMGSVFAPENLMREARRQKNIPEGQVPQVCVLDPDGDIVRNLLSANRSRLNLHRVCYHTRLYDFECDGIGLGVIGCAVGAPFAVLVAEELFSSGCRLIVSITSSGQILPKGTPRKGLEKGARAHCRSSGRRLQPGFLVIRDRKSCGPPRPFDPTGRTPRLIRGSLFSYSPTGSLSGSFPSRAIVSRSLLPGSCPLAGTPAR
jgi:hypothetical protein